MFNHSRLESMHRYMSLECGPNFHGHCTMISESVQTWMITLSFSLYITVASPNHLFVLSQPASINNTKYSILHCTYKYIYINLYLYIYIIYHKPIFGNMQTYIHIISTYLVVMHHHIDYNIYPYTISLNLCKQLPMRPWKTRITPCFIMKCPEVGQCIGATSAWHDWIFERVTSSIWKLISTYLWWSYVGYEPISNSIINWCWSYDGEYTKFMLVHWHQH